MAECREWVFVTSFSVRPDQRHIIGYVRNLSDGSVLVCAVGTSHSSIEGLKSALWKGPRWSEVRNVFVEELTAEQSFDGFRIFP